MSTRYKPLNPANAIPVEFAVKANDSDGIAKAELFVFEYEMYLSTAGDQSIRQRPGGTWGSVNVWNYPSPPENIDEKYTFPGFPGGTFVTYIMEVTDTKGESKNEQWEFAAGDWLFGNAPIPVWVNDRLSKKRVNIAFVAEEEEYAQAREMLPHLEPLIFDGFHSNNGVKLGKTYWQFYYSPERGHIEDFGDGKPPPMTIPASVFEHALIDNAVIIHTHEKQDWSDGRNFGTEPANRGTALHETGHSVFTLADEYPTPNDPVMSNNPHHNVYGSEASCQAYNTSNTWPPSDCENIKDQWWRSEPEARACIMDDDRQDSMPEFARTCLARIKWYYGELEKQ